MARRGERTGRGAQRDAARTAARESGPLFDRRWERNPEPQLAQLGRELEDLVDRGLLERAGDRYLPPAGES